MLLAPYGVGIFFWLRLFLIFAYLYLFPLSGNKYATIISAYAPTMTNPDEVKDKFYNDLDDVISATSHPDKLILLGDFNANVGTNQQTWEGAIDQEGVGKCNGNGLVC